MNEEPRSLRDARLAIREIEQQAERVHMAPAAALDFNLGYYLRKARLALRQAERAAAKADDPRLEPLKPLSPQLGPRRASCRPRRKRYRCPACFIEPLISDEGYLDELNERHACMRQGLAEAFEPVQRLRRKKTAA